MSVAAALTERDRLVTEFRAAMDAFRTRPWDDDAETVMYRAAAAIREHDRNQTKMARRPH